MPSWREALLKYLAATVGRPCGFWGSRHEFHRARFPEVAPGILGLAPRRAV
jgi:hypothetical protein